MSKYLQNRHNKEEGLAKLEAENFERRTFSFYKYVKIEDPQALRDQLFRIWHSLDCLGRVYVAKEGINAQMNVPEYNWDKFKDMLYSFEEFNRVPFKHAIESPTDSFWKLIVTVKDKVVADGIEDPDFDASDVGTHLNAQKFNSMLGQENTVCVDMRNFYESEVGHFEGAILPAASTFREELPMAKDLLEGQEDKDVLLYCTGGIRCEKASAYLRKHGFKKVHQLHGGIIEYKHEVESKGLENKFIGKNFVFDERLGERVTEDIISTCHLCGAKCDNHTNCMNKACNLLFIECEACIKKLDNCCSEDCKSVVHLDGEAQKEAWKKFKKPDDLSLSKNPYRTNIYKA